MSLIPELFNNYWINLQIYLCERNLPIRSSLGSLYFLFKYLVAQRQEKEVCNNSRTGRSIGSMGNHTFQKKKVAAFIHEHSQANVLEWIPPIVKCKIL